MTLQELLQHPNALPAAPKVIEELISSFDDDDVAVEEISRKLSLDPVLSAKLLRLANSAYYHVSRRIGNVDDAVRMLGFVTVRTLVVSSGLVGSFKAVPGLDLKQFWRYSLHSAVAAKWIAKRAGANAELAFTIGMMHGLGQLVIHGGAPEAAARVDRAVGPYEAGRCEAEQAAMGFDFSEVGAALAESWKFPELFPLTICAFPDPLGRAPLNRMAAVLHLALWRARAGDGAAASQALAATLPLAVAESIGLDAAILLDEMPPLSELGAGLEELVS